MSRQRILVVEDDGAIRQGILDSLVFAGYQTLEASRGDSGLEMALHATYDLLLLDIVLPALSGLEILRQIRESRPTQPVIMLTAKGEENDRIQGLKLGADDYVVKPFSVRELAARVEAVLRRSPERPDPVELLELPCGTVDFNNREIEYLDGERGDLSERESDILRYMAGHAGRTISRDELMSRVWRLNPQGINTRAIDMQIARLREKLRDDASDPQLIRTIRGKGYLFVLAGEPV